MSLPQPVDGSALPHSVQSRLGTRLAAIADRQQAAAGHGDTPIGRALDKIDRARRADGTVSTLALALEVESHVTCPWVACSWIGAPVVAPQDGACARCGTRLVAWPLTGEGWL